MGEITKVHSLDELEKAEGKKVKMGEEHDSHTQIENYGFLEKKSNQEYVFARLIFPFFTDSFAYALNEKILPPISKVVLKKDFIHFSNEGRLHYDVSLIESSLIEPSNTEYLSLMKKLIDVEKSEAGR